MRNMLNIIIHDFKRLTASVVAIVILMGVCVVPCLFAWFNIFSNWDPFEKEATGNFQIAVANEDDGAEMLGLDVNVGEKVMEVLGSNDQVGWQFVSDKEKAIEDVRAGRCYAAVVIPDDFTKDVLSLASDELQHPQILFYENDKMNAIAPRITSELRKILAEKADQAFVDTLGKYLTEAASAANAAGLDPQTAFSDLSNRLDELGASLDGTLSMVRAASGLSTAANDLLDASEQLIGSSEKTLELGENLLDSAEEKIPEKADTSSIKDTVNKLTAALTADSSKIKTDLTAAGKNMSAFNNYTDNRLDDTITLTDKMKSSVDKAASKLEELDLTGLASRFEKISDRLGKLSGRLEKLEHADASNWAQMQTIMDGILGDLDYINKNAASIEKDLTGKLDKKLNEAIKDSEKAIAHAREALGDIYGDMDSLESALAGSEKSLSRLQGGLDGTLKTIASLQNGCRDLADIFDNFADSEMLDGINHLMTSDMEVIAENLAAPIKMKSEAIYPIDHFGSVMTPFYTVLAQWIGALLAAVMIRVEVKRREEWGQLTVHEKYFGRLRLFLIVGMIQALLVSLGDLLYVGVDCAHPVLFVLGACVISVVFVTIIYSLVFALENIGLALSVIIMIIQVMGAGGLYPVEVLPTIFQKIFAFMPFQYAINALRECIGGTYGMTFLKCLGILTLFGLGSAIFGLLAHKPLHGMIEKVNESKKESEIML